MRTTLIRIALGAAILLPFARPVMAQAPTPENTVITATATASWQDANANSYTETAAASVTVGYKPSITVTPSDATLSSASPSTGNTVDYVIASGGNGTDHVTLAVTPASGLTVTGYTLNSTPYATLAALQTAIDAIDLGYGDSFTVTVTFSVDAGKGGVPMDLDVKATSNRVASANQTGTVTVTPASTKTVTVTATSATDSNLPGVSYAITFDVENTGNTSATYDLTVTSDGSMFTALTVADAQITLAAGASQTVTVNYTIDTGVIAATTETITLTAAVNGEATTNDSDATVVTALKPELTMTKVPFRNDGTTLIGESDTVVPGEEIWYKITVENTGNAVASVVSIEDPIPTEVTYGSVASDLSDGTAWSSSYDGDLKKVTATLPGGVTIAPTASRFFWVKVTVK